LATGTNAAPAFLFRPVSETRHVEGPAVPVELTPELQTYSFDNNSIYRKEPNLCETKGLIAEDPDGRRRLCTRKLCEFDYRSPEIDRRLRVHSS
jgi:hypothetical protein